MTEAQFWSAVEEAQANHPEWRPGQTAFNVLAHVRPDLSEQVRATNLDPFHAYTEADERMVAFRTWVGANW